MTFPLTLPPHPEPSPPPSLPAAEQNQLPPQPTLDKRKMDGWMDGWMHGYVFIFSRDSHSDKSAAGILTVKAGPHDPFNFLGFKQEVSKVTTGITGLWRPRVHKDVAF